jgi:hypothetical protein
MTRKSKKKVDGSKELDNIVKASVRAFIKDPAFE